MSSEAATQDSPPASPAGGATTPIFLKDGRRSNIDPRKISTHDFHNPCVLSQTDLRNIETLYQRYLRQLGARISTFLRMECGLKLGKVTSSSFTKFCESTAASSNVTLFAIDPLRGVGVLDVGLPLALAMADRLLGGKGRPPIEERPVTEIEMALLDDAMQLFLSSWCDLWAGEEGQLQPRIVGHETSGRALQTAAAEDVFVVLVVEMTIGETVSQFQIGVPFSMIELSVRKLEQSQHQPKDEMPAKPVQWRKPYAGISVPILAEWKVREMPLSETLRINKGDVIQLPGALINKARIRLSEIETYVGTVGIQNGHVAVQITGSSNAD